MSENIIMPKLGMTMKEGTVEEWFKAEGDTVEQGESVCTINSEKLTQDVEKHRLVVRYSKLKFKPEKKLKLNLYLVL